MTQHLGAEKLDHIDECAICKERLRLVTFETGRHAVYMEKKERTKRSDPSFPKKEPFYCCFCKKNTNGLSTCHNCGHSKGRWKTDLHHCLKEVE